MPSSDRLAIRVATAADATSLVSLVNSAYRGETSRAGWTTEADLLGGQRVDIDGIEQALREPGSVILAHPLSEPAWACVQLQRRNDVAYLGMLTIKPLLQGRGVGRQLLAAAEHWAQQNWDATAIEMTVITQRPELIAWYERRGYARTGFIRPFPYGDPRFGLPQRADLRFEVLRRELR